METETPRRKRDWVDLAILLGVVVLIVAGTAWVLLSGPQTTSIFQNIGGGL